MGLILTSLHFILIAEIVNSFISNHGTSLLKWLWSLSFKTTTKTGSFDNFSSLHGFRVVTV